MSKEKNVKAASASNYSLPEGFSLSGSRNAVGWFDQGTVGNTVRGVLIGMFTRPDQLKGKDGESDFFQVEVIQPCQVRAETGANAHMVDAQPGDVVNVNFGPKTKPWKALAAQTEQGAKYEVFAVVAGDKLPIAGGAKKMHNILAGSKLLSATPSTEADSSLQGSPDEFDL